MEIQRDGEYVGDRKMFGHNGCCRQTGYTSPGILVMVSDQGYHTTLIWTEHREQSVTTAGGDNNLCRTTGDSLD